MPARAAIDKARDARQAARNGEYLTRLGAMMAPAGCARDALTFEAVPQNGGAGNLAPALGPFSAENGHNHMAEQTKSGSRFAGLVPLKSEANQPNAIGSAAKNQPTNGGLVGPTDVLVRAIVGSQKILADALEPGGIGHEQAFALLLGILDHEEVTRAVADTVRHPQPTTVAVCRAGEACSGLQQVAQTLVAP